MSDLHPYRIQVDVLEIHDPETDTYWRVERDAYGWSYSRLGSLETSASYPKTEAIARCKEAILALRGGSETRPKRKRPRQAPRRPAPTPEEKAYMAKVSALGCICDDYHCQGRAQLHHMPTPARGVRSSHFDVVPLCEAHHLSGGHGIAIHSGREAFEAHYGSESELLAMVRHRLAHTEEVIDT